MAGSLDYGCMRDELLKIAFTVSQYSGPLSYGPFPMVSSLPDPASAGSMQTLLTSRVAKRLRGEPVEKIADVSPASPWNGWVSYWAKQESHLPDPVSAGALQSEITKRVIRQLEKRGYAPLTPAGRLARSMSVGAPKMSAPPGPSIADIAKPKGPKFGGPIPGAKKGVI
jgi:hypothetical protein